MDKYDFYITLIIILKVIFLILSIARLYVKRKKPNDKNLLENIEFWKDRLEFIFIVLMSLLLIYLFNPKVNRLNMIDYETKLLLYLFGFILLIIAKWDVFIEESPLFKELQSSLN